MRRTLARAVARLALAALLASAFAPPSRAQVKVTRVGPGSVTIQTPTATPARAGLARAAVQEKRLADDQIAVRVYSPWPTMVYQGYFPLVIEVENFGQSEEDVDIELTRGWSGDNRISVDERITVPGGGRVRRELFLGATLQMVSSVNLTARCAGDRGGLYGVGPSTPPDTSAYPVLYAYDADAAGLEPAAGDAEAWGQAAANLPPSDIPEVSQPQRHFMGAMGYVSYSPGGSSPKWHPAVTTIGIDELSPRYEPYTSLKGVILDVRGRLPRAEVLEALLSWTRLGGCLVLNGADAERVARTIPGVAEWMEERFLLERHGTNRVYACAQGALVIADEHSLTEFSAADSGALANVYSAINAGLVHPKQLTASPTLWGALDGVASLAGMNLPYRGFALLLILFALAIGPVNLIVIKKLKRPALLLITVPALALVFSFGLFAYGVAAQGLGTRAATTSLTWLDQRGHHASTLELRSTFAGMPHGDGWRAGPGTSCYALPDFSRNMSVGALTLDFDGGTSYRGDFLPVRREARNAFLVDRAARGRLDVREGASGVEIDNGLGARIDALALATHDGRVWSLARSLEAGGHAVLEARADSDFSGSAELAALLGDAAKLCSRAELVPGSYIARLESSPFTDACGIDYDEEDARHVVFGILGAETEAGGARK